MVSLGWSATNSWQLRRLAINVKKFNATYLYAIYNKAVGRSENPGVSVLFRGHNLPPLVDIGLTDLPKSGGTPPGTTGLYNIKKQNS